MCVLCCAQVLRDMRAALEGRVAAVATDLAAAEAQLAAADQRLGEGLAKAERKLGMQMAEEAAARKLGLDKLQRWFDQNQVDQKAAEAAIQAELDSLGAGLEQQGNTLRGQHDQLRAQMQVCGYLHCMALSVIRVAENR